MSLRISNPLAALALLAGCGAPASPPPPGDDIDCAIGAGAEFAPVCTLELVAGTDAVVVHHPDGGFRRLRRDSATGLIAPSDGAESLRIEPSGKDVLQFTIGADRYHIPRAMLAPPAP